VIVERGWRLPVEAAVHRILARNDKVRALIFPQVEFALKRAHELDGLPAEDRGPLHRVPYSLKDVWETPGLPTTYGVKKNAGQIATTLNPIHHTLLQAGAVLVGKSNVSDRLMTPESDNLLFGATCHPQDLTRTAGGSSGGAAAAVADGMAAFDWGTDFGGSIRLPAAFCGVVGLRLSTSTWPPCEANGPAPPLTSFNGMGPIAYDVEDCASILGAMTSSFRRSTAPFEPRGVAILGPDEFSTGAWPTFREDATRALATAQIDARDADLPLPREIDRAFAAMLGSHLGALLGEGRVGLTLDVLSGLLGDLGLVTPRMHSHTARVITKLAIARVSIYSSKRVARGLADHVRRAAERVFEQGRLIVCPTTTHPAPRHGEAVFARGIAAFAKLGNVIDATCVAVPFGVFPTGEPRSIQVLGPPGSEDAVLHMGRVLSYRARGPSDQNSP
jgi:Asp-tRNA(Asn)/Glu-tRNA(Gln) amidotransferase A subunit family amidase